MERYRTPYALQTEGRSASRSLTNFPACAVLPVPLKLARSPLASGSVVVSDIEQRHRQMDQQVHAFEVRFDDIPAEL